MGSGFNAVNIDQADKYVTRVLMREVVLSAETPGRDRVTGYKALYNNAGMIEDKNKKEVKLDVAGTVAFMDAETLAAKYFHQLYDGDPKKVMEALQQFRENKWKP